VCISIFQPSLGFDAANTQNKKVTLQNPFANVCLILPDFAQLKSKDLLPIFVNFCLILPDFAFSCLILPFLPFFLSLTRAKLGKIRQE
jgi:hypothetical protein